MRRLAIFIVILIALLLLAWLIAPLWLRQKLNRTVRQACPECVFEAGHVSLGVFPLRVNLVGTQFGQGDPRATRAELQRADFTFFLSTRDLLRGELRFPHIEVRGPEVVVTEGDLPSPRADGPATEPTPLNQWVTRVGTLEIRDARFRYHNVHRGKIAPLEIHDLRARMQVHAETVVVNWTGQLEHSGQFWLNVTVPIALANGDSDVELIVKEQNLADLTPFFGASEGIQLKGSLYDGRGSVQIRGPVLTGSVQVKYLGLDFHFEKTKERGAVAAFFANIGKSLTMNESTVGKPRVEQTRPVKIRREPKEALLHFFFRGLSKAALAVVTS